MVYWFLDRAGIYGSGKAFNFSSHKGSEMYIFQRAILQQSGTDLLSKYNGEPDLLFRLAQVKSAAIGDGHVQLIERTGGKFR